MKTRAVSTPSSCALRKTSSAASFSTAPKWRACAACCAAPPAAWKCAARPGGASGLTRVVDLLAILDLLARAKDLRALASASYEPTLHATDQGRMERVCDFIHEHLTEDIDRAQLAKLAHLSEGAFSRFFRSRTGKTVPEYINEVRIGRACRLIAEDQHNITDIALDCGYRNLANFNRRFREVVGRTPREYRAQMRTFGGRPA